MPASVARRAEWRSTFRRYGRHTDRTRLSCGEEWGNCRSAAIPMGRNERPVKPSAKPTLVRTQHLLPPAKTARGLGIPGLAGRLAVVPPCLTMCRCELLHSSGYGHIADRIRPEQAVHRTAGSSPRRRTDHLLLRPPRSPRTRRCLLTDGDAKFSSTMTSVPAWMGTACGCAALICSASAQVAGCRNSLTSSPYAANLRAGLPRRVGLPRWDGHRRRADALRRSADRWRWRRRLA